MENKGEKIESGHTLFDGTDRQIVQVRKGVQSIFISSTRFPSVQEAICKMRLAKRTQLPLKLWDFR